MASNSLFELQACRSVTICFHRIKWFHLKHEKLAHEKELVGKSFVNMLLLKSFLDPFGYDLLFDVHELIVKKIEQEGSKFISKLILISQKVWNISNGFGFTSSPLINP